MIENVIGLHALPLGIALNFLVNGRDVLVPMAIEEPSVVAGASFMAKLAREGGGFLAHTTAPEMIGQMQIVGCPRSGLCPPGNPGEKASLLAEAVGYRPGAEEAGRRAARPGSAADRKFADRAFPGGAPDL